MSRPRHAPDTRALLFEKGLKEIPPSSDSKSLLYKALDMDEDSSVSGVPRKDFFDHLTVPVPSLHSPDVRAWSLPHARYYIFWLNLLFEITQLDIPSAIGVFTQGTWGNVTRLDNWNTSLVRTRGG